MSKKKALFFNIFTIIFVAVFFSYSLVFALPKVKQNIFSGDYSIIKSSDYIFLDSKNLENNFLFEKGDFSSFKITGDCALTGEFVEKKGNYNIFNLKILDKKCSKNKIIVNFNFDGKIKKREFILISPYNLYSLNLDKKTISLEKDLENLGKNLKILENDFLDEKDYFSKIKNKRKKEEIKYMMDFLKDLIEKRNKKYKIPVIGAKMPTRFTKMPNSPRPYRKEFTDNFHHGWDFDAEKGDAVVALDDAIVVRVVKDFSFGDLGKVNHSKKLNLEKRLKNLDLLRGNQVWLKTMKGDVAFYSHLDKVFDDIKEGEIIKRGQPIGLIGSTGVPDKDYDDFHLHLPIQKNPYLKEKIGKNNIMDYMKWDWYLKGKSFEEVKKEQYNIFEEK